MGITFNGSHSDDHNLVVDTSAAILPPIELITQEVPGRPGVYLFWKKRGMKAFVFPVGFVYEDGHDYHERLRDLAAWLDPDDEVKELVLDNEPDKTYFAVVSGSTDMERIARTGQGAITFICPDPFAYGPNRSQLIHDPGGDPEANSIIENNGTEPTYPTFIARVTQPITFIDISNGRDFIRAGQPVDIVDEQPFEREQLLMWSQGDSLDGWTEATEIDGGVVTGSMRSNGTRFEPVSFGTGSAWHGPAMKTSIPGGPITDFRMDAIVGFWNSDPFIVGRVELYLLDEQNRTVAKVAMKDTKNGASLGWGEARAGDNQVNYYLINEYGDREGNWNNFYGMLRIERIGNVWNAYIAKIDQATGRHHTRRPIEPWTDDDNVFNRNVAQVVVHFGQYGNHTTGAMGVYDIKVWRINSEQDNEIPYLFQPDDVVEFDHKTNGIFLNGEPILHTKDFGSQFFALHPGQTEIAVQPANSVILNAQWDEVFK